MNRWFQVPLYSLLGVLLIVPFAMALPNPDDDMELITDWNVQVTENGVERSMQPVDPSPNAHFRFVVDQKLAPGWTCEVLPLVWHGNARSRWLTCQNGGKARVSIKTSCRSDKTSSRAQELWLGDQVSIELACRSGVSP